MKPAVFIDRDGTLNVEKNYLFRIDEFEFEKKAVEAVKLMNDSGFLVILVTNQSGIARGFYTENDIEVLHNFIQCELAKTGAHIDACYFCPHHVEGTIPVYSKSCSCRKPKTGMFERALDAFNIDVKNSWMIGDRPEDMEFGNQSGITPLLVETGYGKSVLWNGLRFPTLLDAARYIVKKVNC